MSDSEQRDLPPIPDAQSQFAASSRRHSSRSKEKASAARLQELASLLNAERRDHHDTQRELEHVKSQLRLQTLLTQEAENKVVEATSRLQSVNEERMLAVREAARLNESLRLYRFQLETAQNEINRAQSVFNIVEKERFKAEAAGARSRDVARRLHQQQKIFNAREQGRREGLHEGLEAGRLHVLTSDPDGLSDFEDFDLDDLDPRRTIAGSDFEEMFYEEHAPAHRDTRLSELTGGARRPQRPISRISNAPSAGGSAPAPAPAMPAAPTPEPLPIPLGTSLAAQQPPPAPAPPLSPINVFAPLHPTPIHNAPPHALHQHSDMPPDGYIPVVGPEPDALPVIPPPHEFVRQSVVVEEHAVSPSAFARQLAMSPRAPSTNVRADNRGTPSVAGSTRSVKMPTPRSTANLPNIEEVTRRASGFGQSSTSSGTFNFDVVTASPERPESQMFVGDPSLGQHLFGQARPVVATQYAHPPPFDPSVNPRSPDLESEPSTLTTPPQFQDRRMI